MLAALLTATTTSALRAHDLERTQVTLSFAPNGAFVLEVANDPDWLLLRLAPFAEGEPPPTRLPPDERDARLRALAPVFVDRIVLFVDGREVRSQTVDYAPPAPADPTDVRPPLAVYRLRGRLAPDARTLRWFYGLVIDPYPLTIRRPDGRQQTEWVEGANWNSPFDLTGQFHQPTRLEFARQYLSLGYEHILPKGLDHILFVIGLFLLSKKWRPLLMQVTAFTVAHSITLGLSMYGIVSLPSRVVEPLIALSIAYVAIENLFTADLKPWRVALVFAFGLLHGMGFAGVLRDLGLPASEFLTALLSFNLGVEGGQLSVIAAAFVCVAAFRRREWYRRAVVVPVSLAIAAVGLYWTFARLAG